MTQNEIQAFINKMAPLAVADMKQNRILASITVAQACVETGYGKSALMMANNAPFGVKATETWLKNGGKAYNSKTGEVVSNQNVTIVAAFRAYNSLADGVADHANILKLAYYNKSKGGAVPYDIVGETDYRRAAECLLPYATGKTYVQSVRDVIEAYGLARYDSGVTSAGAVTAAIPAVKEPAIIAPPIQSAQVFSVGGKVKILPTAVMYTNTDKPVVIPDHYKNIPYTAAGVRPDKVLIKELNSWVLSKDLAVA